MENRKNSQQKQEEWLIAAAPARKMWGAKNVWPYAKFALQDMYFTAEEQGVLDMYTTDIQKFRRENCAKFVTGDKPLSKWDGFVQGLKDMHVEEMLATYQAASAR